MAQPNISLFTTFFLPKDEQRYNSNDTVWIKNL